MHMRARRGSGLPSQYAVEPTKTRVSVARRQGTPHPSASTTRRATHQTSEGREIGEIAPPLGATGEGA